MKGWCRESRSAPFKEAMSRPRRLAPRYPAQLGARVVTSDGQELHYPVRDVSRGGAFLHTDAPLEIFSEVAVHIALPDGQVLCLPSRVVHIMSSAKASALGIPAGMGLQFEPSSTAHQEAISALVDAARAQDRRARVPRRTAAAETAELEDPMLAFVLAAVDGQTEPEALAELLALELDLAERLLRLLADDGLVEFVAYAADPDTPAASDGGSPAPRHANTEAGRPAPAQGVRGGQGRPPQTPSHPPGKAGAMGSLPFELDAELATRLAALAGQDHYQALGIPRDADTKDIRGAFFELSKRFHPDAYFGRIDADAQRRLEKLFGRLSEAYGVLGRKRSRREYDEYLTRHSRLDSAPPSESHDALPATQPEPPEPAEPVVNAPPVAKAQAPARSDDPQKRRREAAQNIRRALSGTRRASRVERPEPALPERCLAEAESALRAGRHDEAMRSLKLIGAMDIDGPVKERADRLRGQLMRKLAFEFEKKAIYEERHQKWAAAARSWRRVCEGRPEDAHAFRQAARAYLEAKGDLRVAAKLAQRAVQLAPKDPSGHRILGHVYMEADMTANARTSLERAVRLGQGDAQADRMLKGLKRAI